MRRDLPTGTVTFVFTDIEGSTRMLAELGSEQYGEVLSRHHAACREAWAAYGGVEVDTAGDAFFVAFPTAAGGLRAALDAQGALAELGLGVRMGVHTGDVSVAETGYVGLEVHRAARIAAAAHGGQIVVSASTAALAARDDLVRLGEHRFKDIDEPIAVFQLGDGTFPPLRTVSNTNLPIPASSFVGREGELAEVLASSSTERASSRSPAQVAPARRGSRSRSQRRSYPSTATASSGSDSRRCASRTSSSPPSRGPSARGTVLRRTSVTESSCSCWTTSSR
jgi:class 3 adenylate cyclase